MYWLGEYQTETSKGKKVKVGFFDKFLRKSLESERDYNLYLEEKYQRRKKREKSKKIEGFVKKVFDIKE